MDTATQRQRLHARYRAGILIATITALLTVWTTIVHDDGNGAGELMVILAAGVGAFATRGQAAGLARSMSGVALMRGVLTALVVTAPATALTADGGMRAAIPGTALSLLWLLSAACFRSAAHLHGRGIEQHGVAGTSC